MTAADPAPAVPTGAGVALITLFEEDGALAAERTGELAARIVDAGAASVLTAGTVGEFFTLEDEERIRVLRAVRRAVPAGTPVVAHVGGVDAARAADLATRSVEAGADCLLALPPGEGDIAEFFAAVLGRAEGAPVLAYHLPQAGAMIPLDIVAGLGVAGIKDSSGDAERLAYESTLPGPAVVTGASSLIGFTALMGGAGALVGSANIWPDLCRDAWAGSTTAQRELSRHVSGLGAAPGPREYKAATAERWQVSARSRW